MINSKELIEKRQYSGSKNQQFLILYIQGFLR